MHPAGLLLGEAQNSASSFGAQRCCFIAVLSQRITYTLSSAPPQLLAEHPNARQIFNSTASKYMTKMVAQVSS